MTAETLHRAITEITTDDYSQNHGGVPVMIDNREASFGSVVGYALYNKEDPAQAVADCLAKMKSQPYNGHKLVWVNLSATCICGDAGYYEREAVRRAAMPKLRTGDLVRFEGNVYEIVPAPNRNFGLRPVAA